MGLKDFTHALNLSIQQDCGTRILGTLRGEVLKVQIRFKTFSAATYGFLVKGMSKLDNVSLPM